MGVTDSGDQMPRQVKFVRELKEKLAPDDRLRGLWLTGSMGRGDDDPFSDVDCLLVVDPPALEDILQSWPSIARGVRDCIYLKQLGRAPVFNHILAGWLRWDVTIMEPKDAHGLVRGEAREIFNKDAIQLVEPAPSAIDRDAVLSLSDEFIRCLGLLPVVVGRGDPVAAASGAGLIRQHLVTLMRLTTQCGGQSGALRLKGILSGEDYTALAAIPPVVADLDAAIAVHQAAAEIFLARARALLGTEYPHDLESACLIHLAATLGARWAVAPGAHGVGDQSGLVR